MTFQDITHPDDLEADLRYVRRLLEGEIETYSMEKRYIKKDGSAVWIYLTVSLVREPSGEPSYLISAIEVITERKRTEETLRRSEAGHFAVVDTAFDAIVTMRADGIVHSFNQGAERIFGFAAKEAGLYI